MLDKAQRKAARYGPAALQMPQQAPPINRTTTPAGALNTSAGIEANRSKGPAETVLGAVGSIIDKII